MAIGMDISEDHVKDLSCMCTIDDLFIMCSNMFYKSVLKIWLDNINPKKYSFKKLILLKAGSQSFFQYCDSV